MGNQCKSNIHIPCIESLNTVNSIYRQNVFCCACLNYAPSKVDLGDEFGETLCEEIQLPEIFSLEALLYLKR